MSWIEAARRVVAENTYQVVNPDTAEPVPTEWKQNDTEPVEELVATNGDGVLLDLFSASAMVQVYDALSEKGRAKFDAMPLLKAQTVAFKVLEKVRQS